MKRNIHFKYTFSLFGVDYYSFESTHGIKSFTCKTAPKTSSRKNWGNVTKYLQHIVHCANNIQENVNKNRYFTTTNVTTVIKDTSYSSLV